MDKGLALVVVACVSMLVLLGWYQLSYMSSDGPASDGSNWDSSKVFNVVLMGDSITVSSSRPAVVSGSRMTIKSAGTYNITGSLTEGQIVVQTKDAGIVRLVLNGVNITCSTSAPICVLDAEKVEVYLENGTENFLSDGASPTFSDPADTEPNAALFSKTNMVIMGEGVLNVVGKYNDGIT